MRGVVLSVVLPRRCLGLTDVGGKLNIKNEKEIWQKCQKRTRRIRITHTPQCLRRFKTGCGSKGDLRKVSWDTGEKTVPRG